jgi:hypothetical protein
MKLVCIITVDPDELLDYHRQNVLNENDVDDCTIEGVIESELGWILNSGVLDTNLLTVEQSADIIKQIEENEE